MGKISEMLHGFMPVILMVIVQIIFAGVNILYKLAVVDQFSISVLVAYRFLFSAASIVPVALYVERKKRPKLTWMILFQAFLCALFGATISQNLFAKSLALTSATFATAIINLTPAFTFVLAIICGMEKLGWRRSGEKAKVLGTLSGIGGAMLLTFYKGTEISIWKSSVNLLTLVQPHNQHAAITHQNPVNMVLGAILALGCVISSAIWFIIQAKMAEKYPCPYSCNALFSVMGSFQGLVYALCTERDWSQWKLGWNIRLFTVAYTGILGSGVMLTFVAWGVQMRGPLFVSIFNPLMLVIVAIAGSMLMGEHLYLGSVLGAILIVCGLYLVIWGKGKDMKRTAQLVPVPEEGVSLPETERPDSTKLSKCVQIDITSSAKINAPAGDHSDHLSSTVDESLARGSRVHSAEVNTNSEGKEQLIKSQPHIHI